jgi:hypothetical protein
MNREVLDLFKKLFTERCNRVALLNFGEDSVRYDFFCALSSVYKLNPWDISLEYAFNPQAFNLRKNLNSKRKEKPMLDLVLHNDSVNMCAEFGMFRQNSNDNGTINQTEKTVKMLMDMVRVGLESFYSKREAYFICVADDKMLKHQLRSKIIGPFPSSYTITMEILERQMQGKTSNFDMRFVDKFKLLNSRIVAKLIYDEEVEAEMISRQTKLLAWKVVLEGIN